jgi:nicotinic acid mononucleotide adenylyltransferase
MVDLAIEEDPNTSSWVVADPWESTQPHFISFYTVVQHLDQLLAEKYPNENIEVIFLCGADLVLRAGGLNKLGKHSVVAVGRSGWTEKVKEIGEKDLIFIEENTEDISSTQIREKIDKGEDLTSMTYKSVENYLKTTQIVRQ